jgi:hypothetical protein
MLYAVSQHLTEVAEANRKIRVKCEKYFAEN